MSGIIESGDLVEVMPLTCEPTVGDVVLCKVHGSQFLHVVRAVQANRVQIGNAKGHINGWTPRTQVYGRVSAVNPAAVAERSST